MHSFWGSQSRLLLVVCALTAQCAAGLPTQPKRRNANAYFAWLAAAAAEARRLNALEKGLANTATDSAPGSPTIQALAVASDIGATSTPLPSLPASPTAVVRAAKDAASLPEKLHFDAEFPALYDGARSASHLAH